MDKIREVKHVANPASRRALDEIVFGFMKELSHLGEWPGISGATAERMKQATGPMRKSADELWKRSIGIEWRHVYETIGIPCLDSCHFDFPEIWDRYYIPVLPGVSVGAVIKCLQEIGCDVVVNMHIGLDLLKDNRKCKPYRVVIPTDEQRFYRGKSYDEAIGENVCGMTLLEYLLVQLGYHIAVRPFSDAIWEDGRMVMCNGTTVMLEGRNHVILALAEAANMRSDCVQKSIRVTCVPTGHKDDKYTIVPIGGIGELR